MISCFDPKDVHVNAYKRVRFDKLEHVREHWRSHPYTQGRLFD